MKLSLIIQELEIHLKHAPDFMVQEKRVLECTILWLKDLGDEGLGINAPKPPKPQITRYHMLTKKELLREADQFNDHMIVELAKRLEGTR